MVNQGISSSRLSLVKATMAALSLYQLRLTPRLGLYQLSPSSSSMVNLPAEIWHMICGHVDRWYLAPLRRVCSKLADIAATYLFEKIYVNWLSRSFEKFTAIAAHPKLRYHVKALLIEQNYLHQRYTDFETWKLDADTSNFSNYISEEEMAKGIEVNETVDRYRSAIVQRPLPANEEHQRCLHQVMITMLTDQRALLGDSQLLQWLDDAISKMPDLSALQTTTSSSLKEYLDTFNESRQDFDRSELVAILMRAETFLPSPFDKDLTTKHYHIPLQPINHIFRAAFTVPPILTTLSISALPFGFWDLEQPQGYWNSCKIAVEHAFTKLRLLRVGLIIDWDRGSTPSAHHQIAHFLGSARDITTLVLTIDTARLQSGEMSDPLDRVYNDGHVLWDISNILSNLRLLHLQTLKIKQFCVTEDAFSSFMRNHAETLRNISFSASYIKSPTDHTTRISGWERALKEIAPAMSLKDVHLGLFEDPWLSAKLRAKIASSDPLIPGRDYSSFCTSVEDYLRSSAKTNYPKFT